ncbi:MAG TPA: GNAT family N-acetyltransferase [Ktedonobacterales bacterium]|nr:GNAT family N-acetyltransferase [Ktedonobacterales bacterium]
MDWTIREATIADYDALCALFAQIDRIHYTALPDIFRPPAGPSRERKYIEDTLSNPGARIFAAEQGNEIIGLADAAIREAAQWSALVPRSWVHIRDIIVDERFRGMGVGKSLLARIEAWARELRIPHVELLVWEFNTPARMVYEQSGFRTLSRTMYKDLDG